MSAGDNMTICRRALAAIAAGGCRVRYGNRPAAWTCFDELRKAQRTAEGYERGYRVRILKGANLCAPCRAAHALRSVDDGTPADQYLRPVE